MTLKEEKNAFYDNWRKVDLQYEEYAKRLGLSYTSMQLLYYLYKAKSEEYTQKSLCEKVLLPKQTVNSIVKSFIKQGYLTLIECADDRRIKLLSLTTSGREYCEQIFQQIDLAEDYSLGQFSPEKRQLFIELMKEYADAFEKAMN